MAISFIDNLARETGRFFHSGIAHLGGMSLFFFAALRIKPKYSFVISHMVQMGINSLFIVILASIFTGFITTWQVQYLAGDIAGLNYLGMLVLKAVLTELGPTLIGLVLAGRIGAKVAAEVGTMRITEQVDAMICLSLNPIKYIVTPRIISGIIMTPVLFIYGSVAAIVSSQLLATLALGLHPGVFYNSMKPMFEMGDLYMGLTKSLVFGTITTVTGAYFGYYTRGGAMGVGRSTRNAVVSAAVLILFANVIVSQIFSLFY
ncbi:MlaE family ABC transporter permease [Chitinivibrio alkaliphilus]|uniref:ABC transporter permease protein n=1 Tax=Chitinivibrio alkaliphilus ACht1 TaxID=1313304 RepID=U7D7U4_9BACT|nr:ABC transporter permease [Chitinivibrio alkaliphilus]ERP31162.1 ABC transporter permease protein [Chitinivibrio alkaliphilus ACht1]